MENSRFFSLHDFSRLEKKIFKKVPVDRNGSVEVRETLFKALRTSVGAE